MDNVANIRNTTIEDMEKTNIFWVSVYANNDNSNTIQAYLVPDICYPYEVCLHSWLPNIDLVVD